MFSTSLDQDVLKKIFFISERLIVFDGMGDVFGHIVKTAVALTQAEAATIRVFDFDRGRLEIASSFGLSPGFLSQRSLKLGEGITGRVVLNGEPFMSHDVSTVRRYAYREVARSEGIKAVMSIPLKGRDKCIGCITVYRKRAGPFTDHDQLVLRIFGMQAAEAIEKTHLLDELKRQASYDSLTGAYNRAALLKVMEKHLHLSQRQSLHMGVIFIDVDHFKAFNDRHGHLLGDKLLCDFAKAVQSKLRRSDSLARFGGEEFVVLAPHASKEGALALARKLRRAIAGARFLGKGARPLSVTFSAGIASYPEDANDVNALLKKADEAMYRSKATGRDRITAWTPRGRCSRKDRLSPPRRRSGKTG